ncbi:MAG: C10 family peptidase [candidate division Zixibacteria bacterium]
MLKEFLQHTRRFLIASLVVLAILISFSNSAYATIATENEMDQVCKNWLSQVVKELGSWGGSLYPEIEYSQDIIENDTLLGRYYSISPSGFIVIPALRELAPVKAYSEETSLNIDDEGGMALMFRQVLKSRMDIYTEVYGSLEAEQTGTELLFDRKNEQAWDEFTVSEKEFNQTMNKGLLGATATVGPLLTTSWHQRSPYNLDCPTGYLGRTCLVGCVSTAASQIIYYHKWPPEGTGDHSYYWVGDYEDCGGTTPGQTLYADFSDPYTYDHSNASVAEICYEMGVAYNMKYGTCKSGAFTLNGDYIFPQYFQYDQSARRVNREDYSADEWFDLIKENIDKNRPTLYRIYSHAIVCDGWREIGTTKQYHMNYGWGGSQNAWFTLDNLHCDWSEECGPDKEGMVVDIIPLNGAPYLESHELSDASSGDGDGIPEAGETIEMYFTIANYGGVPIENIYATLTIDDGTLNITDDASFISSIPAFDSVTSYGDPFIFEIPANYVSRIDSFFIEVTWNDGQDSDKLTGTFIIGNISVLLVDDDNYKTYEDYYKECLDKIRMPCSVWTYANLNPPPVEELNKYDLVIWFTGDDRATTLNSTNIGNIKSYLDGGGNLFLTGQGIASQLATDDPVLLNNYLKTEYQSGAYSPIIISETASQLLNPDDTLVIYNIGNTSGANNQTNTERITPVNGGIAQAHYVTGDHYSIISYSGADFNTLFFGFGFEGISLDTIRFVSQDSMVVYILDFFGTSGPPSPPSATGISVAPGDPDHMTDHVPEFSWSYFDGDSAPQSHYQIQVTSDLNWYFVDMWDTGPVAGSETSVTYFGSELFDGITYYVRVRVSNGLYWSDWISTNFAMNGLPGPPVGLSPDNEGMVTSSSPELSHDAAPDPDGLPVDYSYELYSDITMTNLLASADDQPQSSSPVTWQVPVSLGEDQTFYWRVRADDALEDGQWSELASFCVNADNQSPAPFELTSPDSAVIMENLLPTFTWTASSDADINDEFTYMLRYSKWSDFASPKSFYDLTAEEYTITTPLEYGIDYYWKVVATDLLGAETICSNIRIYITMLEGDANADRTINVGDAVFLINHVFKSGPAPVPLIMGDANCDAEVNVGDAVYLINNAFKGGPAPGCD